MGSTAFLYILDFMQTTRLTQALRRFQLKVVLVFSAPKIAAT